MAENKPTVIVRRVKKGGHAAHHGGAWKVAYADFVTAMMAFFLVLWLMAATTKPERASISEYFRNPSPLTGQSPTPAPGMAGPGGASTSMIKLGGATDVSRGNSNDPFQNHQAERPVPQEDEREREKKQLEVLKQELEEAISKSQALEPFKDQLLLDLTPEGLRIQIVDKQNRPMFDMGSAALKTYTRDILRELSQFINHVPNRISITGHTDITAYNAAHGYSNWELSADRANAARRALLDGGMADDKVTRVVGLSSSVLFDKTQPDNPINRRISIVVMTKAAEAAALAGSGQEVALSPTVQDADIQAAQGAPAPAPAAAPVSASP
ncbi:MULTISPECIES: flagellar motor protein MotB [Stenotrophomonas]|jgi:chemotaxis protein MotB|uniref:Chemotaxis protein MotB n=1 Tax=Stenotrophomonas rhizophila TaxID=216778 RepID=A0AAP5AM27_9GAMM|nr:MULTISPECIES: flagellar motor protein MotB [Stenotrophomonas]MDQ1064001.1 chemotaxis protein MotB [Stenotrophomonas sp. SORGH_AS_0282]MDQ1109978.1 chemotaxis protein MotB [Stenotrophomonas rhizophila]MDQ1187632.1 chemotaxis protein MotB [Stenotrophomonas sp. SORGH_AS_0282]PAK89651.1 flagellar motor protein MotB [Stenotrophomonas rhizophila]UQY88199.1 flagellar motor protein MotB [Stenotrophomonas rhizophila]